MTRGEHPGLVGQAAGEGSGALDVGRIRVPVADFKEERGPETGAVELAHDTETSCCEQHTELFTPILIRRTSCEDKRPLPFPLGQPSNQGGEFPVHLEAVNAGAKTYKVESVQILLPGVG